MKINKNIVVTAALLAALTIMIGAFGAHGLKELISEKSCLLLCMPVATYVDGFVIFRII